MEHLIEAVQDGDTEALEALWERTKAFALAVSRRFRGTSCVDSDDLQQCAYLGFHAAAMKHRGKYHFLTLLDFCVRIECQKALHIRTSKRDPVTVSYDIPAPDGEQAMLDLFVDDSLPESDAQLVRADLAHDIRAAVAELPERERLLIELRWLTPDPLTLEQTGEAMCISRERVRLLEQRAFERLRDDPVLRSYVEAPPPNLYRSGLSHFTSHSTSMPEHAALRLITADERRKSIRRTHAAYAELLASLRSEGYL